jgi:hypothetical protein
MGFAIFGAKYAIDMSGERRAENSSEITCRGITVIYPHDVYQKY